MSNISQSDKLIEADDSLDNKFIFTKSSNGRFMFYDNCREAKKQGLNKLPRKVSTVIWSVHTLTKLYARAREEEGQLPAGPVSWTPASSWSARSAGPQRASGSV